MPYIFHCLAFHIVKLFLILLIISASVSRFMYCTLSVWGVILCGAHKFLKLINKALAGYSLMQRYVKVAALCY